MDGEGREVDKGVLVFSLGVRSAGFVYTVAVFGLSVVSELMEIHSICLLFRYPALGLQPEKFASKCR